MSSHHYSLIGSGRYPRAAIGRTIRNRRFVSVATDAVIALAARAVLWLRRRHTRQVLAALDDKRLHDIGLTRNELSKL